MCLRGVNSSETHILSLPYLLKNSLVMDLNEKETSLSPKSENSSQLDVLESWEQLLDKQNEKSESSLEDKSSSEDALQKEIPHTLHSLNSQDQPTTVIANVLEISNMPPNIYSEDIYKAFDITKDEMTIKWVNRTKARLYFPTEEAGRFFYENI